TISPPLLPVAIKRTVTVRGKRRRVIIRKGNKGKNILHAISLVFRAGIIAFLAILMTQPINVMIFSPTYEEADKFISTLTGILNKNSVSWLITILGCIIFLLPVYFKYLIRKLSEKSFKEDFEGSHAIKGLKHL